MRKVPEGYLYGLGTNENGVPEETGTPGFVSEGGKTRHGNGLAFGSGVGFGVLLEKVESRGFFRRKLGGFRNFFHGRGRGHFRQQLNAAVVLETGSRRDEAAHDDVFLEAAEIIDLAGDRSFRKDACGLLEAGCGDERVGRKRRLGDTQEQRAARCGAATVGDDPVVLFAEAELVHLFFEKERGVSDVFDFDPAHHLPRNGFDVLVVDVHALEAVNLLNGVHQVRLRELFAQHGQQVVQVERAVDQSLAGLDVVAFLDVDVHAARNRVFLGGLAVFALDVDFAHALGDIAVADTAVDFADDGGILGLAGLEEFDDARETARDVLGLGGFARNFREHVAGLHFIAILNHQVSTGRHEVLFPDFTGGVAHENRGLMFFITWRQRDDVLREASHFVDLFLDGQTRPQ